MQTYMSLKYEPASEPLHILMNGALLFNSVREFIDNMTSTTTY